MATIETERLVLRPYTLADCNDLHAILGDPITMSFWPAPFTLEATTNWINRALDSYARVGFGRMATTLKSTGELIGDCAIMRAEIDGQPENDLGWIIHHPFWKHGYAIEAARALRDYGFGTLGLDRLCANMAVNHVTSRAVAERLGMRLERQFRNHRNRDILTCLYVLEPVDGGAIRDA